MSNVISTTVNYQATTTVVIENPPGASGTPRAPHLDPCELDACLPNPYLGARGRFLEAVDSLPLPGWLKAMIKDAARGEGTPRVCVPQIKAEYMPSEGSAAKTINEFQKKKLCGERLSIEQMDQMARTGYLKKKDGCIIKVPDEVRDAARRFMADGAKLFRKMESATDCRHDGQLGVRDYREALDKGRISSKGPKKEIVLTIIHEEKPLPSEFGAAKTINDFQNRQLCGGRISVAQMEEMARSGCLTRSDGSRIKVPDDVQAAARRFMANGAELFKKMESATDGRYDGQLGAGDYFEAFRAGKLGIHDARTVISICRGDDMLPSEPDAARTVHDFQHDRLGGERLSAAQMLQMARTGYLTKGDKCTIEVPPEMQAAARRFIANGGELFKKMESATDGRRDGQLGMGDYHQARDKGLIFDDGRSADVIFRRREFVQPTESSAARTIHDFQRDRLGGERLNALQMAEMARTGCLTKGDGCTIRVSPDVQAAAQRFVANGGELFKKMESATDGQRDGQLGMGDYDEAIARGRICRGGDKREVVAVRDMQILPNESDAARTVHDFQRDRLGGERLTALQMDEMARFGYLRKKDGSMIEVPPDVQLAAQRFMANGSELFKKMESATDGRRDGQLGMGDYDQACMKGVIPSHEDGCDIIARRDEYRLPSASGAAKTIHDFQQDDLDGARLTAMQMDEMARTGYLKKDDNSFVRVPDEVRDAARRFMANGGELFREMESSTDGKHDGQLGVGDYDKAIDRGTIGRHHGRCEVSATASDWMLPSEFSAAKKIHDFQQDKLDGGRLTIGQMDEIATTGKLTKKDGSTIPVSPEVQDAARRFMANDAELFKKMESATDGKYDGQLGTGDYDKAVHKGRI